MEDPRTGGAYLSVRYSVQVFEDEFFFLKMNIKFLTWKDPHAEGFIRFCVLLEGVGGQSGKLSVTVSGINF